MHTVTVYHLSPARYRGSIEREGIRRSSMFGGRLVTHVYSGWPNNGQAIGVAEQHDTMSEYMDVWKCRCESEDVEYCAPGERVVRSDIPRDCVERVRSGKLEI